MKKVMLCAAAIGLVSLSAIADANLSIETVAISNAGNVADTTGYGSVAYNYNIGKYEVTAGQYTAFLNAKANVSDTYGLYNSAMWSDSSGCKIQRTGDSGNYTYSVASDYANKPVNYVSYWDACRFTNWLGNGQGAGSTETGAYTLNGYTGSNGSNISRNTGATWAVTSEDEWYKAAYYKGNDSYSLYANGSSTAPVAGTIGSNYASIIGSIWDGTTSGALEQNGTKDMMGNVFEWNEAIPYLNPDNACHGLRGGTFSDGSYNLQSLRRNYTYTNSDFDFIGFRVSEVRAVPEPSSIIALLGGLAGLIGLRRRGKR